MKKIFQLTALFIVLALVFTGCPNENGPPKTKTFTVSFHLNGVDGTPQPADQIVEAGKTAAAPSPAPSKQGYTFKGWSLTQASDGSVAIVSFPYTVNADINFYAVWEEGMTAMGLVKDMKLGVNIGNSFDSVSDIAGQAIGPTGWGNPNVSQAYIKSLKTHGFTTVRFPVTWADYIGAAPDYTVNPTWMTMIKRVVDWTLAENMYCILNVHHDGADINNKSWIEDVRLPEKEDEVKDKFAKLWNQIAVTFNYASDLLVLESMNEPQYDKLWPRTSTNITNKTRAFKMLTDLNQIFVDTVRATGGNNAERCLLISSYWTDIDINVNNWGTFMFMPQDTAENKLILSFHYYTPWNFCGGSGTTWTNTTELNNQFNKVKTNFVDRGIPVIIGEYAVDINANGGAINGTPKNTANRRAWMLGVTQKCVDMGVCPILWDTGMRANNKGMADVERSGQLRISDDLAYMIQSVVWP
jgi:endoglucanase